MAIPGARVQAPGAMVSGVADGDADRGGDCGATVGGDEAGIVGGDEAGIVGGDEAGIVGGDGLVADPQATTTRATTIVVVQRESRGRIGRSSGRYIA
jgi:hypothetical protein